MDNKFKNVFFFLLIFISYCSLGQNDLLIDKNWKYKALFVISDNRLSDTLTFFHTDSTKNLWNLRNISFTLLDNNTYNSSAVQGSWQLTNNNFIFDSDSSQIIYLSHNRFITKSIFYLKSNGSIYVSGKIYSIFYNESPCNQSVNLNSNINYELNVKASSSINTTNAQFQGDKIQLKSEKTIILNSNTEIKKGSVFYAFIGGCSN